MILSAPELAVVYDKKADRVVFWSRFESWRQLEASL